MSHGYISCPIASRTFFVHSIGMSEDTRVQYKFMIPERLKEQLEAAAYEHRRSLSAEIISRLEGSSSATAVNAEQARDMVAEIRYMIEQRPVEALFGAESDLFAAFEKAAEEHFVGADRPEAAKLLIRNWLTDKGYLPK